MPQRLERVPEPSAVMDSEDNVQDFDAIMGTNISISLCGMIDLIGRLEFDRARGVAVDLACGPGHFTLMLAEQFEFERVIGIDLSPGMIRQAEANAQAAGLADRVSFMHGDATSASELIDSEVDLVTCTNSAHHLPTHDLLARMVADMDRMVGDQGLAIVMDLTRLKTAWAVERYVKVMGQEYLDAGLEYLFDDFRNSMFAAWTEPEMQQACPRSEQRAWFHFALKPLPINQFLVSFPKGSTPKLGSFDWVSGVPMEDRYRSDFARFQAAKEQAFKRMKACPGG